MATADHFIICHSLQCTALTNVREYSVRHQLYQMMFSEPVLNAVFILDLHCFNDDLIL